MTKGYGWQEADGQPELVGKAGHGRVDVGWALAIISRLPPAVSSVKLRAAGREMGRPPMNLYVKVAGSKRRVRRPPQRPNGRPGWTEELADCSKLTSLHLSPFCGRIAPSAPEFSASEEAEGRVCPSRSVSEMPQRKSDGLLCSGIEMSGGKVGPRWGKCPKRRAF